MALTKETVEGIKELMERAYRRLDRSFEFANSLRQEDLALALREVANEIEKARNWIRER